MSRLLLSSGLAAALAAAAGTALTTEGPYRLPASFAAFALGLSAGPLLGLVQMLLARLFRRPWARFGEGAARFLDPRRDAPREPVIALHATALAAAFALGLFALGTKLVLMRLRSIEDENLAENLGILGVCALFLITAGIAVLIQPLARRGFAWVDSRVGLPQPQAVPARLVVWVALPVALASGLGLWRLESTLGPLSAPLWLGLALSLQLVLHALLRLVPAADRVARWPVPVVLSLVGLGAAHALVHGREKLVTALDRARPGNYLAKGARALTDVDGDGASALFGGGDCAPFAAARGPHARDKPGNGLDENCDGKDAVAGRSPKLATYTEQLPARSGAPPDVLWIVVDALRADHTSLLGYPHQTTPMLEELARESWVFTNAFSQSSATMLSYPSMLSGIDPGRLMWREDKGKLQVDPEHVLVSKRMQKLGYYTGFVANPYMRGRLPGLLKNWNWIGYLVEGKQSSATATARAMSFLVDAQTRRKPFFLMLYMPAPHAPYIDHGREVPRFQTGATSLYDEEIADADRHIGFVLNFLKADPKRWKNTIVVVTADHGEEFGEHGGDKHARTCHVESVHVPLVVRLPGQKKRKVTGRVALVDVVPTLLEAVSAPTEENRPALDGQSLFVPALTPDRAPEDRPIFCSVISQNLANGVFLRRSVDNGRYKLTTQLRGVTERALYDVKRDRKEQSPLVLEGAALRTADELDAILSAQFTGNLRDANLND